jgi:hypothetical protein
MVESPGVVMNLGGHAGLFVYALLNTASDTKSYPIPISILPFKGKIEMGMGFNVQQRCHLSEHY